jgi:hypothetical protein
MFIKIYDLNMDNGPSCIELFYFFKLIVFIESNSNEKRRKRKTSQVK